MLQTVPAKLQDVAAIQELARKHHLLRRFSLREGFLYVLNPESVLRQVIEEELSRVIKSGESVVGYILVASEQGYVAAYSRELGSTVRDDYHSGFQGDSAIVLQSVLDGRFRTKINAISAQTQMTDELFQRGFKAVYAEGCLNPFNPRTYYVLSEVGGWRRRGFQHIRPQRFDFENDSQEIANVGGFDLMFSLFPQGFVFGLYSKHKN